MILRRISTATLAASLVVGVVTACSSVPDITFDDGDASTLVDGGGGRDGTTDAPADAPRDVSVDPNCVKSGPESCEDGLDNDCNGLVDCADPACQPSYECVERAPPGFELVGVADSRAACPTGYTAPTDLEMFIGATPPSCACSCNDTCKVGTGDVTVSTESACTGGTTVTRALSRTQAACTPLPGGALAIGNNNQRYEAATGATAPTTCDPNVAVKLPPQVSGRTCKPPPVGQAGGCGPTQVCIRKATTGFAICAAKTGGSGDAGSTACVAPYVNKRRAGTSVTSTPTCSVSGCSCNGPTPCTGTFTIFEAANCTGKSEDIPAGETCAPMAIGGAAWTALAYKATSAGGCTAVGNPAPQGTLEVANEQTICCK